MTPIGSPAPSKEARLGSMIARSGYKILGIKIRSHESHATSWMVVLTVRLESPWLVPRLKQVLLHRGFAGGSGLTTSSANACQAEKLLSDQELQSQSRFQFKGSHAPAN